MPKRVDFTLRLDEQRALERLIQRGEAPVAAERAQALLKLYAGKPPKEVAQECYVSQQTIYGIVDGRKTE